MKPLLLAEGQTGAWALRGEVGGYACEDEASDGDGGGGQENRGEERGLDHEKQDEACDDCDDACDYREDHAHRAQLGHRETPNRLDAEV